MTNIRFLLDELSYCCKYVDISADKLGGSLAIIKNSAVVKPLFYFPDLPW